MSLSPSQAPIKAGYVPRIILPFLETGPVFDLRWCVLLLPLWWAAGLEQFIWPVLFGFVALKMLYRQRLRITVNAPLRWFTLFLLAVLISGFFIVEPERRLTYVRNLGAFSSGYLVLLIASNQARSWRAVDKLLDAALLAVIVAGVAGLLAAADIWRPSFQSLVGQSLPADIANTSYGRQVVLRTLGQRGWFVGLGQYFRLNSFFLFGNHYSSVLIYAIPFLFFRLENQRGYVRKGLVGLALALLITNLVLTTGRVALIALLAGALYFALFHSFHRRLFRVMAALVSSVALLLLLFSATLEFSTASQDQGLVGGLIETAQSVILARGEGSLTSRMGVYQATLAGFVERPLFGWGTERDVPGLALPAGSHSEYLAALYRQGLFGLFAFLGLLWSVWRATRPPTGDDARDSPGTLLRYGRWFLVAALINSIMNDPAVDATTYVLLWLFIGLLVASAQQISRENPHVARRD